MHELKQRLIEILKKAHALFLRKGISEEKAQRLAELIEQVDQPGMLAICGWMKIGKSTLINVLLGRKLAVVDVTEATATINVFQHGIPDHSSRPVKCVWRDGHTSWEPTSFMDALQTKDLETLKLAATIDQLVFMVDDDRLRSFSLADTPGRGSTNEQHQKTSNQFLKHDEDLRKQIENDVQLNQAKEELKQFHEKKTQGITATADAVLYLVGPNARDDDQEMLLHFRSLTQQADGQNPMNVVGVLTKVDELSNVEDRFPRAKELEQRLVGLVHSVLPTSAGLFQAVKELLEQKSDNGRTKFDWFVETIRTIPANILELMLFSDQMWIEVEAELSQKDRVRLHPIDVDGKPKRPWEVFKRMALVARDESLSPQQVEQNLLDLSGIKPLVDLIDRLFLQRGQLLRWRRIAHEALQLVINAAEKDLGHLKDNFLKAELCLGWLEELKNDIRQLTAVASFDQGKANITLGMCHGLFVSPAMNRIYGGTQPAEQKIFETKNELRELNRQLGKLKQELNEADEDFRNLQTVELLLQQSSPEDSVASQHEVPPENVLITKEQLELLPELKRLFGRNGLDVDDRLPPDKASSKDLNAALQFVRERQQFWSQQSSQNREFAKVEQAAATTYGRLLYLLREQQTHNPPNS